MHNKAKLTLVGAGPGDPDLITLKGIKALRQADVVLYDALISKELLDHAPRAEKIYVGKRRGIHRFSQEEINEMIVRKALGYGHVVRLKGGDPFVFGRGSEEIEHAQSFGIPTDVIPGVSSSLAVPSSIGIPLTKRGISESFWVITGCNSQRELSRDLELAARSTATLVILMGMGKLAEIMETLQDLGKGELPVAVIQNGTLPDALVGLGTVDTIRKEVVAKGLSAPAVIVIGEVARFLPSENAMAVPLNLDKAS